MYLNGNKWHAKATSLERGHSMAWDYTAQSGEVRVFNKFLYLCIPALIYLKVVPF